jgi:hypothetical protein
MIVHNASTSVSFHECQMETVLISGAGGGAASSGNLSTTVGVRVVVVVIVTDGSTVGVTVPVIIKVVVSGRAVVRRSVTSRTGLPVSCGRGYGSLVIGRALVVEAAGVRGIAREVPEAGAAVMALVRVGRRKGMVEVALARGDVQEESINPARRNQVTGKRLI